MTQIILRATNGPALVLIAMLGLALQTSLFTFWILPYVQPGIVLLLTVWFAMRRGFTEGGILTLVVADIAEIHSAAPSGLYMISFMLCFLLVRVAARLFVLPGLHALLLLAVAMTAIEKTSELTLLHLLGMPLRQLRVEFLHIPPTALVNAAWARWLYPWLESFDALTGKTPESPESKDLSTDELGLGI